MYVSMFPIAAHYHGVKRWLAACQMCRVVQNGVASVAAAFVSCLGIWFCILGPAIGASQCCGLKNPGAPLKLSHYIWEIKFWVFAQ
jgi:hypothetical protein